jgi:hypothetical protein
VCTVGSQCTVMDVLVNTDKTVSVGCNLRDFFYILECWRSPDFESLVNAVDGVLYVLS